ncbi:hypothetical protein ACOMCU_15785 [Lysinibacillus sp. UGB7]|uniref:hypothetical protein n=1 Tax=Lysinibacillus sp. UGB7 TaxID=3411039 RepID=UPI003B7AA15A
MVTVKENSKGKYTRTGTPSHEKKAMLVRLEKEQRKRVENFQKQNRELQTDQSVALALFEFALDAFERGEFVLIERSSALK